MVSHGGLFRVAIIVTGKRLGAGDWRHGGRTEQSSPNEPVRQTEEGLSGEASPTWDF